MSGSTVSPSVSGSRVSPPVGSKVSPPVSGSNVSPSVSGSFLLPLSFTIGSSVVFMRPSSIFLKLLFLRS